MRYGFWGMLAGCACMVVSAAVQNVTITEENAYAYNAENRLACDSGSKILVKYSYRADGKSMKEALLDFIDVSPPADGVADPWVSIRVLGAGLTNDVDFTEQPYMWLGTTEKTTAIYLAGVYEPYGDVYRLGYGDNQQGEYRGLVVTNMTDNPVTGVPRSVLAGGTATVPLKGGTYTGGVVAEGPVYVAVTAGSNFGTGYKTASVPALTLRSVNGKAARLLFKNSRVTYPSDLEIRNEGTNEFHSCGASGTVNTTLQGPVTGWGQINLTDQGGLHFTSAGNTFTGVLNDVNTHGTYGVEICIGDGVNCSWAGSKIVQTSYTNHFLTVHCNDDFTLNAELSANGGRLVKKGVGTLTLAKAFPRTMNSSRKDIPVMQILGGTVKRTQTETTAANGLVEIAAGATLDLNQIAATSIWLPVGGGVIVNPAGGAVTLKGPPDSNRTFYGSVAGRPTVSCTTSIPWNLGAAASFEEGLSVTAGTIQAADGFSASKVALSNGATLQVATHEGTGGGLKVEAWWTGSAWTGDTHTAKMATALAYSEAHASTPNFTGDMSAWGETFYSGTADATGGGPEGALAKTLGSSRDQFFAKFTGYFIAEETGVYGFRAAADDGVRIILDGTNQVVNIATGSHSSWGTSENVFLEKGRHPMTVYFLEEAGWEILWVQMKAPGATSWSYIPLSLLSTWDGRHCDLGRVTGEGAIGLAASDVVWPSMDLSGFTGRLLANEYTATTNIGTVTPVNSYLHFHGGMDYSGTNWWRSGNVSQVVKDGRLALDMGGVKESNNYVNRQKPLDLSKPFTVSFDFSIHAPWAGDSSLGDGFALMLNNSATTGYGGTFSYADSGSDSTLKIANANAYGMMCYLMPTTSRLGWIKDSANLGTVTRTGTYIMNNAKNRAKPFHAMFSWDLEKLVFTFSQQDQTTWSTTNTAAAADLAAKFPSGQAYLGLWARNGGYYCTMLFENLVIDEGETTAEREAVVLNGVLGITNGTAQVIVSQGVSPVLASDLQVVGAGGIRAVESTEMTGEVWSFNLADPATKLFLDGAMTFPNETPITVEVVGEVTPKPRVLADLTGVEDASADRLGFKLDESLPTSWKLVYSNRRLSVFQNVGTVIFIK